VNQVTAILHRSTKESYRRSFLEAAAADKGWTLVGPITEVPLSEVSPKLEGKDDWQAFVGDCK
jgi:hypothetical protein